MARLHAAAFTQPRPWSEAEIAALIAGPGGFAVSDPAGFAIGRAIAGEAELLTIAVDPALRRRGSGRALLARFEEAARARGAQDAFLEVAADNTAARALYLAAGYGETGRRRGYYRDAAGQPVDALILARALGPGASAAK